MNGTDGVLGAAAGAIAVALFAIAAALIGARTGLDASGAEVARFLAAERTRIQIGCAVSAAAMPFLIWFLAIVATLARREGGGAERAGALALGCGVAYAALFLADVSALAVGALRPETLTAAPELATVLHDLEWTLIAVATPFATAVLAACATLALRYEALWPRWLGWFAAVAAAAYSLRIGVIFTIDGVFAADGVLGLWVPVVALTTWLAAASISLALSLRRRPTAQGRRVAG